MSRLFFTKRVFRNDEPTSFCGVDIDQVGQSLGLPYNNFVIHNPDTRWLIWRDYLLPALKDSLIWRSVHWLRFIVDWTDRHYTRIWVYGRVDDVEHVETQIWPLLQTRFVSFSANLHLSAFNRAWSLASFCAPRIGSSWKVETVRRLESIYEDNFNLLITDDYELFADFE